MKASAGAAVRMMATATSSFFRGEVDGSLGGEKNNESLPADEKIIFAHNEQLNIFLFSPSQLLLACRGSKRSDQFPVRRKFKCHLISKYHLCISF